MCLCVLCCLVNKCTSAENHYESCTESEPDNSHNAGDQVDHEAATEQCNKDAKLLSRGKSTNLQSRDNSGKLPLRDRSAKLPSYNNSNKLSSRDNVAILATGDKTARSPATGSNFSIFFRNYLICIQY
jgi:hypothetical protein